MLDLTDQPLEPDQPQDAPLPQEPEAAPATIAAAPDVATEAPAAADAPPRKRRNNFTSLEIADQVHQVQEWLTSGYRPNEIRRLCSDAWGLNVRVAESRMQLARRQMVLDVNDYDRKEMAAKMLQSLETVLKQALDLRQGSNAIGAMRLQADLLQLLSRQN